MTNLNLSYKDYFKIFDNLNNIKIIDKNNKNITIKIIQKLYELRTNNLNAISLKYCINNNCIKPSAIKKNSLLNINNTYFYNTYSNFFYNIQDIINENIKCKNDKWLNCLDNCYNLSKNFLKYEVSSTIYYFILFGACFISLNKKNDKLILKFNSSLDNLNGIWLNDMKYFKLISFNNSDNGRLIMGFGPSASGKTYWTKNIIEIINSYNNSFPTRFLTIDGGIQREVCISYQIIKNIIKHKCNTGFKNLMSSSIFNKDITIFSSSSIKKNIIKFLQIEGNGVPNLYIPETLGGCSNPLIKCSDIYKKYIKITNDNKWISLLIWQHLETKKCDKQNEFKCTGTIKSGKLREIDEGKKYSSIAYNISMKYGLNELNKSNNIKINIHNSGGLKTNGLFNKSTIISNLELDTKKIKQIEEKYNCVWSYANKF